MAYRRPLASSVLAAVACALAVASCGPLVPGASAVSGSVAELAPAVVGGVMGFGDAQAVGFPPGTLSSVVTAMVSTPDGGGYWLAAADGEVYALGDASFEGSLAGTIPAAPVVGMAATPDGQGYWLTAADGEVFAFGDAAGMGSLADVSLSQPIVGMAATPDGGGYWLVAADGGVFAFGDAAFYGSTGGLSLVSHVVGMAATPDGKGYWLVAADGGVFAFGDAGWYGSMGERPLDAPIVGMAATGDGGGYWLVAADGGVFAFGNAPWLGSPAGTADSPRVAAIAATPDGDGYWLLAPDRFPSAFTDPSPLAVAHGAAVVRAAVAQVGVDPAAVSANRPGHYRPWNSLFACWAWDQAGMRIPQYPQSRSIFLWANEHAVVLRRTELPAPGDIALFGAGAASNRTPVAAAVVVEVWPDGAVLAAEGDAGPGGPGDRGVVLDGPFLPSQAAELTGSPLYGYAQPR